jgi:hypothetical protein
MSDILENGECQLNSMSVDIPTCNPGHVGHVGHVGKWRGGGGEGGGGGSGRPRGTGLSRSDFFVNSQLSTVISKFVSDYRLRELHIL